MDDAIAQGLKDCDEGVPFTADSVGAMAAEAAYAVLRCCSLIRAGDIRVPQRIGRSVEAMIQARAPANVLILKDNDVDVPPPGNVFFLDEDDAERLTDAASYAEMYFEGWHAVMPSGFLEGPFDTRIEAEAALQSA